MHRWSNPAFPFAGVPAFTLVTTSRLSALVAAAVLLGACKETPAPTAAKPPPAPTRTPAPAGPQPIPTTDKPAVVAVPNYDVKDETNAKIRQDVLDRVDRLPNLTTEQRNKLYASVDRARGMGCVLVVPFLENKRVLAEPERKVLVNGIRGEAVQKLVDDSTLVFVIIGYANEGTDSAAQEKLAAERAESVLSTIRDQAGVTNTMYAAGMGAPDVKLKAAPGAGRVAEIWAVFPDTKDRR